MPFWFIFPAIFIGFFLMRFLFWGRWGWYGYGHAYGYGCGYGPPYGAAPPLDAREELRQRLARGDITPEEYEKRRQTLVK